MFKELLPKNPSNMFSLWKPSKKKGDESDTSCSFLLFDKDNLRVKNGNLEFDVTIVSYNDAELCESVDFCLQFSSLRNLVNEILPSIEMTVLKTYQVLTQKKKRKKEKNLKIFKRNGLSVAVVECSLIAAVFLI